MLRWGMHEGLSHLIKNEHEPNTVIQYIIIKIQTKRLKIMKYKFGEKIS